MGQKRDVLPDSRAREAKHVIRSPFGNLIQVFCANCGCEWGRVKEEEMTFAFVLCNRCAENGSKLTRRQRQPMLHAASLRMRELMASS